MDFFNFLKVLFQLFVKNKQDAKSNIVPSVEEQQTIEDLPKVESLNKNLPVIETIVKYIEVDKNSMINLALSQYGISEKAGEKHNEEVLKYFREMGYTGNEISDETAWCSAFMNYIAKISGYEYTGKLDARSWLRIGEKVEVPQIGDVAILWRSSKSSWKGHVAFFISQDDRFLYLLGGNQNNKVQISRYSKGRFLGFRRLKEVSKLA